MKSKHASFPFVLMAECEIGLSALRVGLRRAKPFTDLLHVEVLSLGCGAEFRRLRGDKRPSSTRRHSWLFRLGVNITCSERHAPLWARVD